MYAATAVTEDFESCPDPSDQATKLEFQHNADSLAAIRRANAPQSHPDFDGVHCLDCDTEIPRERLAAGRIRCTDCQSIIEQQNARRRH